jgi:ABC-type glutathione transport system ATPase component
VLGYVYLKEVNVETVTLKNKKVQELIYFLDNEKRAEYTIWRHPVFGHQTISQVFGFSLTDSYSLTKVGRISNEMGFRKLVMLQRRLNRTSESVDVFNFYCEKCTIRELVNTSGVGKIILKKMIVAYLNILENTEEFESARI